MLRSIFVMVMMLNCGLLVRADEAPALPPPAKKEVDFKKDIAPLFKEYCIKCHGPSKQRGDFRLDEKAAAMKGGENFAPAIIPNQSADSPLIKFTAGIVDGMQMPPEGESRLSADEVGLLRAWIDQGAKWPDPESGGKEPPKHWSFQPVQRSEIPIDNSHVAGWARNPIDQFVMAQLNHLPTTDPKMPHHTLAPSPEVDRVTLIRRMSFDLLGLPPTPLEVDEFVADSRPDAVERSADRLLASPHFGERWARHWLDVVRFAESDGFETNQPRPNAWPYRDYVIRAFNEDKSLQSFLFEQLAGDAVGVDEATGFLVGGAWDRVKSPDPGLTAQQRADELHDMVSTTGSAFIGLTVGCARCHNHKFDPITQTDYYSMKAVFAGVQHGERPLKPADFEQRQQHQTAVQAELATIESQLARFEPFAYVARHNETALSSETAETRNSSTILIDDESAGLTFNEPGSATMVVPRIGVEPHRAGTGRGQLDDPGDASRLPNIGRSYSYWNQVPDSDVFTWNPHVSGRWHIWVSWGTGWDTHAAEATYLLDSDGDLTTRNDQQEIARVDQRRFADGSGGGASQPLWSGFFDAGVHWMTPSTRLVLRNENTSAYITADVACFQRVDDDGNAPITSQPRLRPSVHRQANLERFAPVKARFVRFQIEATSGGQPCLDEVEVFSVTENGSASRNVALASHGTKATSSSNLPGYEIHQLRFVNDGRYGNAASWISNEAGRGWIQLEFTQPMLIDRIVWSRDRPDDGQYQDRIPTKYRIEAGLSPDRMQVVASSDDRLSVDRKLTSLPTMSGLNAADQQLAGRLVDRQKILRQQMQNLSATTMAYAGRFVSPEPTNRLHRGDPLQPKESTPPASLHAFGTRWELPLDAPEIDRRQALAKWITSDSHPLTMRVMVNRMWHSHFGQGLVTTPSDFGRNGGVPSHPALLDWLASEAREGVSPKRLHRMMVTSAVYRQSSVARVDGMEIDAGNRLLWRYSPRRLEAEPLRDAILAVSGNLDDRMYGVGFDLFEPNTNYVKVYNSKRNFGPGEWRRMVYQSKPRMQLDEVFGQFDCPDAGQITPKRTSSITALQALNLLNSSFGTQQATQFATRVKETAGGDTTAQVTLAWELAFQRQPAAEEVQEAMDLVKEHGLAALCRALLNSNEFLFVF